MDDQDNGATAAEQDQAAASQAPQPNGADTTPAAGMIAQYVKDLSFENPNAPGDLPESPIAPQIEVQFNIGATPGRRGCARGRAEARCPRSRSTDTGRLRRRLFSYGGLFGLRNVPAEAMSSRSCSARPRACMFPFARRILADAIRDGGFPPLLLEPHRFQRALYLQQAAQRSRRGRAR